MANPSPHGPNPPAEPPADPAADKHPNAGRNLPVAIGVGVLLGAILLGSVLFSKPLFVAVILAAVLVGIWEFNNAFLNRGIRLARTPVYASAVLSCVTSYVWGMQAQLAVFGFSIIAILIWRIRRGTEGYVKDVTASVFVTAYLPFMVGFVILSLVAPMGQQRVIVFFALTVSSDIGGYIAGVLFGKHPIAKQISPKKSWEGFAGSIAMQAAVGAWLFIWFFDAPWWQGVLTGMIMTVTATAGDFAESAVKRDLGVKDMSQLVPGHGGLMDRMDSLIPNAFVSWAMLTLFLGS